MGGIVSVGEPMGVPMAHIRPTPMSTIMAAVPNPTQALWHCRYAHTATKTLNIMFDRHLVHGFSYQPVSPGLVEFCEGCTSKQATRGFKRPIVPTVVDDLDAGIAGEVGILVLI